jgi:hypothetical protein
MCLRDSGWRKRNFVEKALFRRERVYKKHYGIVVSEKLVEKLLR